MPKPSNWIPRMKTTFAAAALLAAGLASLAAVGSAEEQNAAQGDRNATALLIHDALVPEAAKVKLNGHSAERHREVIKNPIKDIVTYWRSEVSGSAAFVEPDKNLKIEIPTLVRGQGAATITMTAEAPMKGDFAAKALTDDGKQIFAVGSPFTCTLSARAVFKVEKVNEANGVAYKIAVVQWDPTLKDLSLQGALNQLKGPIERCADGKLKADSEKIRDAMNEALRKAYADGRLTLK